MKMLSVIKDLLADRLASEIHRLHVGPWTAEELDEMACNGIKYAKPGVIKESRALISSDSLKAFAERARQAAIERKALDYHDGVDLMIEALQPALNALNEISVEGHTGADVAAGKALRQIETLLKIF